MKTVFKIAVAALMLSGIFNAASLPTPTTNNKTILSDGGDPTPWCDPFSQVCPKSGTGRVR